MALVGGGDHIVSVSPTQKKNEKQRQKEKKKGIDRPPQWEHTYEDYNTFLYYGTVDKLIFYITVALVKVSLTLFIRRLADRASKAWRWFCDFFLFTLVVYIVGAIFWFSFTCDPPRAQWDKWYSGTMAEPTTCIDAQLQGQLLNVAHVVQGAILLASPVVILWSVTMEWKKKLRLFIIWGVGLLVVLFGLMRLLRADFTSDIMWTYTELLIWTALDVSVGIVVISLPVMDAWMAGGWRKAMTKMGRTNASGGGAGVYGKSGYGNLERSGFGTIKSTKSSRTGGAGLRSNATATHSSSSKEYYAESADGIMDRDRKEEAMELAIMRTDEYVVQFSPADEERMMSHHHHRSAERDHDAYGAHACATPGSQTKFHHGHGHGIAR